MLLTPKSFHSQLIICLQRALCLMVCVSCPVAKVFMANCDEFVSLIFNTHPVAFK